MNIEPQQLQQKLASPNPPLLVDVRQPHEAQLYGSIEGSLLIPLNEIPARLAEIPADREVVLYCKMGARSGSAAAWLRQQGRNAVNLVGGIDLWRALGLPLK